MESGHISVKALPNKKITFILSELEKKVPSNVLTINTVLNHF